MQKKPIIIIDTREKEPYHYHSFSSLRGKLDAGDYSIQGLESEITVERKSLNDLVKTVINDRKRFNKELQKMSLMQAPCFVVEGSLEDVLFHKYQSGASTESIYGSILSLIVDWQIPVYFCGNRQIACKFTQDYLLKFWEKIQRINVRKS